MTIKTYEVDGTGVQITDEEIYIPMPDGVRLAARLWKPVSADHQPVPAVFEYIPYRKRDDTPAS